MVDDRVRGHQDVESGQLGPPAVVEILFRPLAQARVRRSDPGPRLPGDEHRARGDEADLAHAVVLTVVHLPLFQRGVWIAEPVGGEADPAEDPAVLPVEDLGAHDAGPHLLRRLDQGAYRRGGEDRVVVEEHQVVRLPRHLGMKRFRHRPGEAGVAIKANDAV